MSKGIAIILMVLAHTNFSRCGGDFINMFHMPLFLFFSGYCFKDLYLKDFRGYAKKRIIGVYLPFVIYSLLFLVLHNIFFHIHIYDDIYGFQGKTSAMLTLGDMMRRAMTIVLTMNETEQLLGGYWFLHSYFIAAFILYLSIFLSSLWPHNTIVLISEAFGMLLCCWLFLRFHVRIPFYLDAKDILAAFFMIAGYLYQKANWQLERFMWIAIPLCLGAVIGGMFIGECSMLTLTEGKLLYFVPSALAGIILVFSVCKLLEHLNVFSVPLTYIGKRTLGILTWHFLCFKAVSLIIVHYHSLPINQIAEFPVITEFSQRGWWLLYVIVGICMPLLIDGWLGFSSKKMQCIISAVKTN